MGDNDLSKHVIAVSSNIKAAVEFGVAPENILPMWDWVGVVSLWSAIGLPIAIATVTKIIATYWLAHTVWISILRKPTEH